MPTLPRTQHLPRTARLTALLTSAWLFCVFAAPALAQPTVQPTAAGGDNGPTAHLRAVAARHPDDVVRNALRAAVGDAVAASQSLDLTPLETTENLLLIGFPVAWVVQEVVFHYGGEQLPEVVGLVRFLYGQTVKDLVRDAVRAGAARRSVERVRMCRALQAAAGDATEVLGLSVDEARATCAWGPVDWNLVSFGEQPTDLRFLRPEDDPGAFVSAQ